MDVEPHAAGRLCDVCRQIPFDNLHGDGHLGESGYEYNQSYQGLVLSSGNCDLCQLFRDGLRKECAAWLDRDPNSTDPGLIDQAIITNANLPDIQTVYIQQALDSDQIRIWLSGGVHCILDRTSLPACSASTHGSTLEIPEPKTLAALECATATIQQSLQSKSLLPTRVIDLGEHSSAADMRLMEPPSGMMGHYITLSHRWGASRNITTTRANRARHLGCIRLEDLPRTFQDTVFVCRFIGIRYLWIDSLCIVQDDLREWEVQSRLMGDIYHDALLTIAAHSADGDHEGFLERALTRPPRVTLDAHEGRKMQLSQHRSFKKDVNQHSPLSQRGWVLQERLLSRLTLHFVPHHIYLESTYETSRRDVAPGFSIQPAQTYSFASTNRSGVDLLRIDWLSALEYYSNCDLTYARDKLPAIAGIIYKFHRVVSPQRCVCGLWENNIREGLLWARDQISPLSRPEAPRAPSWSWAALDGPFIFLFKPKADAKTEFYIEEPEWSVPNGEGLVNLRVHAFVKQIPDIEPCEEPSSLCFNTDLGVIYRKLRHLFRYAKTWKPRKQLNHFHKLLHFTKNVGRAEGLLGWVITDEDYNQETQSDLHFIPVAMYNPYGWGRVCVGLVVIRSGTYGSTYSRVGLGGFALSHVEGGAGSTLRHEDIWTGDRRMITLV